MADKFDYIIVCLRKNNQFDCIIDGLYLHDDAVEKVKRLKAEDIKENWGYDYRILIFSKEQNENY